MKRMLFLVFVALVLIGHKSADAALLDNGGGLRYDSDRNITWYAIANTTGMNWWVANDWAASQNYGGVSGWRLPTSLNP